MAQELVEVEAAVLGSWDVGDVATMMPPILEEVTATPVAAAAEDVVAAAAEEVVEGARIPYSLGALTLS